MLTIHCPQLIFHQLDQIVGVITRVLLNWWHRWKFTEGILHYTVRNFWFGFLFQRWESGVGFFASHLCVCITHRWGRRLLSTQIFSSWGASNLQNGHPEGLLSGSRWPWWHAQTAIIRANLPAHDGQHPGTTSPSATATWMTSSSSPVLSRSRMPTYARSSRDSRTTAFGASEVEFLSNEISPDSIHLMTSKIKAVISSPPHHHKGTVGVHGNG